jgi:hypothetical protein
MVLAALSLYNEREVCFMNSNNQLQASFIAISLQESLAIFEYEAQGFKGCFSYMFIDPIGSESTVTLSIHVLQ